MDMSFFAPDATDEVDNVPHGNPLVIRNRLAVLVGEVDGVHEFPIYVELLVE